MDYLLLKAFHIAAVLAWTGGLLAQTLALAAAGRTAGGGRLHPAAGELLAIVRRWDDRVTTPALLLVWASGLALASTGGWLGAPWLSVKLAVVIALSATHGVQSGALRRLASGGTARPLGLLRPALVVSSYAAVAFLAAAKPFS